METPKAPVRRLSPEDEALEAISFYKPVLRDLRRIYHEKHLHILDVGTGSYGFGRAALNAASTKLSGGIKLFLYDRQEVKIQRPVAGEHVIRDLSEVKKQDIHLVNLSFVLSHLEDAECRETLTSLQKNFASSILTVLEYTLKNQSPEEVFELFKKTKAERECCKLGKAELYRTHARFDENGLRSLVSDAGWTAFDEHQIGPHKRLLVCGAEA